MTVFDEIKLSDALIKQILLALSRTPLELLLSPTARDIIASNRLSVAQDMGQISTLPDPPHNIKNTVRHNLANLDPRIASLRPYAILGPLMGVDSVISRLNSARVLIIGPRTESEIFLYMAHGFSQVLALDLISYSSLVTQGDMHDIPFSDAHFDIVVFSWCLGYSTNQQIAVSEGIRVLKEGGILAIGEQWEPLTSDEASCNIMHEKGYALFGTRTKSALQLINIIDSCVKSRQIIFQSEPTKEDSDRVGLINIIARIDRKV